MKWPSRIVALIFAAALVGGVVQAIRPHPVDVDVSPVVRAPLDQTVVDDGRARVQERYTVSAPVAGTLARIELHEGDVVEPRMVVARLLPVPSPLLDPRSRQVAEQRLASAIDSQRQAQATVTRAHTAQEQAQRELDRVHALVKQGSLPSAQLDEVEADALAVRDGRAVARGVEVGHRGPLQAEVLGGLEAGDLVIIHPGASVHEGARVAFR
jgi:HlyD family secretion protein